MKFLSTIAAFLIIVLVGGYLALANQFKRQDEQ